MNNRGKNNPPNLFSKGQMKSLDDQLHITSITFNYILNAATLAVSARHWKDKMNCQREC